MMLEPPRSAMARSPSNSPGFSLTELSCRRGILREYPSGTFQHAQSFGHDFLEDRRCGIRSSPVLARGIVHRHQHDERAGLVTGAKPRNDAL